MTDKRKFDRFEIRVPARIEVPLKEGGAARYDLETRDLSAGGAFIKFLAPLPEGSEVRIDIILFFDELKTATDPQGSLILSTTGRVVRSVADGVAIRFGDDYEFKVHTDRLHQMKAAKAF